MYLKKDNCFKKLVKSACDIAHSQFQAQRKEESCVSSSLKVETMNMNVQVEDQLSIATPRWLTLPTGLTELTWSNKNDERFAERSKSPNSNVSLAIKDNISRV